MGSFPQSGAKIGSISIKLKKENIFGGENYTMAGFEVDDDWQSLLKTPIWNG